MERQERSIQHVQAQYRTWLTHSSQKPTMTATVSSSDTTLQLDNSSLSAESSLEGVVDFKPGADF